MKIALTLVLAAVLTATRAGAADSSGVGVNGRIVYTEQANDAPFGQIRAANANGTGDVVLVDGGVNPQWSPDARKVLFESARKGDVDLWTVNWDGAGLKEITFSLGRDGDGTWSPDGRRIAFETDRNGRSDVYVASADGSGATRLTTEPAFDLDPAWSPDGTKIAFTSERSGTRQIWLMNADGTN